MNRIIIIGAGASGLMAAIVAARCGAAVTVLEHKDSAGRKILQTGNGRCNITNQYINEKCYQNKDTAFVIRTISQFTPDDTINFFDSIGLLTKVRTGYTAFETDEHRYVYPNSEQASAVVELMVSEALSLGVEFIYNCEAADIVACDNGSSADMRFTVNARITEAKLQERRVSYGADRIIIATGSKAAPKTGSDGSGYSLARKLGHTLMRPLPALVPLESGDAVCRIMAGARSDGVIELYEGDIREDGINRQPVAIAKGELQFTDYGISGIPVFQISRYAVERIAEHKQIYVAIDLLPMMAADNLESRLMSVAAEALKNVHRRRTLLEILTGLMNHKLSMAVIKKLGMDENITADRLTEADCRNIALLIKRFVITIDAYKSFDKAQVCSGGIPLPEINSDTMESRIVQGLYFAGEIADVDGICGGYNLQWAWSSGYVAAVNAAKACKAD